MPSAFNVSSSSRVSFPSAHLRNPLAAAGKDPPTADQASVWILPHGIHRIAVAKEDRWHAFGHNFLFSN
jgi:hypothetical protein